MSSSTLATSTTVRCRILIVDDHPIVRHGLTMVTAREDDVEICGEAANVQEALRLIETRHPDLAIIDISLEGDNGLQLIKRIKSLYPDVKMLVSSMHDEAVFAPRALRAGAHGFISKREPIDRILLAVRQVMQDEVYLSPRMASRLLRRSALGQPLDTDSTAILTDRELEVFDLIGQGLNTQQIAREIGLSPKTVETHRKSIKKKLGLQTCVQLNHCAFRWVQEDH